VDEIKPFMEALLGLKDPWTLTRIEADLNAGQVDLYVDFLGRRQADRAEARRRPERDPFPLAEGSGRSDRGSF
jgi:hypothetical protein